MPADHPRPAGPDRRRRRVVVAATVVAATLITAAFWPTLAARLRDADAATAATAANDSMATPGLPAAPPAAGAARGDSRDAERALWSERLARARATLASYRKSTEYPFNSRPASENADQLYPNRPVVETRALNNGSDEADPSIEVITSQSRIFLASGESVVFTIAARDRDGKVLPLTVRAAQAIGLGAPGKTPAVPLNFNDQGQAGDAQAGDGTSSVTFDPATTPLADFDGTIRVELSFDAGGKTGRHQFDVVSSPQVPAVWAGPFRDAIENGSLALRVPVEVRQSGRYVINARVDDARGTPLALVTFNDELAAGTQPVMLTVFGKLIRDSQPAFPLQVRDVDGYLLREQGHPDRALMPRLAGTVLTTAQYALSNFASAEWQNEVRDRYLREYGKDVSEAEQHLATLGK